MRAKTPATTNSSPKVPETIQRTRLDIPAPPSSSHGVGTRTHSSHAAHPTRLPARWSETDNVWWQHPPLLFTDIDDSTTLWLSRAAITCRHHPCGREERLVGRVPQPHRAGTIMMAL